MANEHKIVTPKDLSDNCGVSAYEFQKHIPKNAKKLGEKEQQKHEDTYFGSYAFKHEDKKRRVYIGISVGFMTLTAYYAPEYPHGAMYNIDWNDTLFLGWLKLTSEPCTILEATSFLTQRGYEYTGALGFKDVEPEKNIVAATKAKTPKIAKTVEKGGQTNLF